MHMLSLYTITVYIHQYWFICLGEVVLMRYVEQTYRWINGQGDIPFYRLKNVGCRRYKDT